MNKIALRRAYRELVKIAAEMETLNHIEDQLGEKHPGTAEIDPDYQKVETRLRQPNKHVKEYLRDEGGMFEHVDESHGEDAPPSYDEVMAEARGLNKAYEMPKTDEYQAMMGRQPKQAFVRKSSMEKAAKMEQPKSRIRKR